MFSDVLDDLSHVVQRYLMLMMSYLMLHIEYLILQKELPTSFLVGSFSFIIHQQFLQFLVLAYQGLLRLLLKPLHDRSHVQS